MGMTLRDELAIKKTRFVITGKGDKRIQAIISEGKVLKRYKDNVVTFNQPLCLGGSNFDGQANACRRNIAVNRRSRVWIDVQKTGIKETDIWHKGQGRLTELGIPGGHAK